MGNVLDEHEILKLRHKMQELQRFDKIFHDIVKFFNGDVEKANSVFLECLRLLMRSCEEDLPDSYMDEYFVKIIGKHMSLNELPTVVL